MSRLLRRCGPHPLSAKCETRQLPSDNNRVLKRGHGEGARAAGPDPSRGLGPHRSPDRPHTGFLFPGTGAPRLGRPLAASTRTALPPEGVVPYCDVPLGPRTSCPAGAAPTAGEAQNAPGFCRRPPRLPTGPAPTCGGRARTLPLPCPCPRGAPPLRHAGRTLRAGTEPPPVGQSDAAAAPRRPGSVPRLRRSGTRGAGRRARSRPGHPGPTDVPNRQWEAAATGWAGPRGGGGRGFRAVWSPARLPAGLVAFPVGARGAAPGTGRSLGGLGIAPGRILPSPWHFTSEAH